MKTIALRNRIIQVGLGMAAAALLLFGLSVSHTNNSHQDHVTISGHHASQVADGSESNGGKGGKGGAKLSGIA